jgi:flagellar hook-length control protein FliK
MNIQAIPAAPKTPSATGGAAGLTVLAAGTAPGKGAPNFAVLLGGQQTADANGPSAAKLAPDDQAASLIGLLQMLQTLLSPLQSQLLAGAGSEQQGAATLPELLLQAIGSSPKLSDQVLQSADMQQWLAQTAALLPMLLPAGSASPLGNMNPNLALNPDLSAAGADVSLNLSAQRTLLQFAAVLKQMPDNPIVRHLMTELQQAAQPVLADFVQSDAPAAAAPIQPVTEKATPAAAAPSVPASHTHQPAAGPAEPMIISSVAVHTSPDAQLQQTKAKLEMLAAKSGGIVSAVQQLLGGQSAESETANSSSQDNASSFPMPALPLQDLLKTLQQTEQTPFRPKTEATINASTFVRDMSGFIANNMKLSVGEAFKEARLSLHPENLGQVDVKITLHANGQLVAQLTADTLAGKQLLESQLPQLRQALQNQGLQVERLEVAQEQAASSSMFQQSRQQGGGGRPFEREPHGSHAAETEAVDAEFAKDLRTLAELRGEEGVGTSGSFDASA